MLVCMLLVVGRSSPRSARGRAWRKSAGSAALRRACLFFFSVALFCHMSFLLCIFVCARPSEYRSTYRYIETSRHDNVKQLVWNPPS